MPDEVTYMQKKNHSRHIITLALVVGAFLLGTYAGFMRQSEKAKATDIAGKDSSVISEADFAPFWKAWNTLNEKYPSASKVATQDKVWGAIKGLASSFGDPYTVFFPPDEAKDFSDTLQGEFSGVGMELGIKDKVLTVIAPLKDTPAYRAGIKPGDKILKIDDTLAADLSIDAAINLVRGDAGTAVAITVLHDGATESVALHMTREVISIPEIDSKLRSDGVFVISLYNFSANSEQLFATALAEFKQSQSKRLILDLRGNPGGYLDSAVDIASWFLPAGSLVVIEDFGSSVPEQIYRSKGYGALDKDQKMIILVDSGSASASEILAGALSEDGVATLVGDTTYGKGSVQELVNITPDSFLKVTIAKWLTPDRVSISEKGITPDVKVPVTRKDIDEHNDPQLNKAVELLTR
jgi:carboxyl-terminal processing protease